MEQLAVSKLPTMSRLDALLRVARHVAWHPLRDLVVLRGGLVMRQQVLPMPRPVDDVDFLIRVDAFDAFRTNIDAMNKATTRGTEVCSAFYQAVCTCPETGKSSPKNGKA